MVVLGKSAELCFCLASGISCVFALHVELAVFLREHQYCHADCFENSEFILVLAYMADIFEALNQ